MTLDSVGAHIIRKFPEEATLMLMASSSLLYERFENEDRASLLRVIVKRLIVDAEGTIVDYELNSPFAYLDQLAKSYCSSDDPKKRSTLVAFGTSPRGAPNKRRSSASMPSGVEFESSYVLNSEADVGTFLAGLRFEKRDLLDQLLIQVTPNTKDLR